jgi:hypothetical protein
MHPHFAGYVRQYFMPVFQFYPKHGIWQGLENPTFNFYCFLFGHTFSTAG